MRPTRAREELERGAGTQFDPDVVAAFLRIPAQSVPTREAQKTSD
jgi:HD-GYP domain-containing protein (c-di-GMP phosphodiesterase class II)